MSLTIDSHPYSLYLHITRVIDSCTDISQIDMCRRLIAQYERVTSNYQGKDCWREVVELERRYIEKAKDLSTADLMARMEALKTK